jgi:hypothetical protein
VHLVGFIIRKFVTMHVHMNVKLIFLHSTKVPFNTGNSSILGVPDLRDCRPLPLKIGLRYAYVSFKIGLAVYFLKEKHTEMAVY